MLKARHADHTSVALTLELNITWVRLQSKRRKSAPHITLFFINMLHNAQELVHGDSTSVAQQPKLWVSVA